MCLLHKLFLRYKTLKFITISKISFKHFPSIRITHIYTLYISYIYIYLRKSCLIVFEYHNIEIFRSDQLYLCKIWSINVQMLDHLFQSISLLDFKVFYLLQYCWRYILTYSHNAIFHIFRSKIFKK